MNNLKEFESLNIDYDNYRISLCRAGRICRIVILEYTSVDRAYLDTIIPEGIIPEVFIPYQPIVVCTPTYNNLGMFKYKLNTNGSITCMHRDTGYIYNNQNEYASSYFSKLS